MNKDTAFHRPIPPLTKTDRDILTVTANRIRLNLTPGCDCAGAAAWGHTAMCRMQRLSRDDLNQIICEADYLYLKDGRVHWVHS